MTVMAERPTTSGTESHDFEELLDTLDELDVPDGYKAEIIRGEHRRVAVLEGVLPRRHGAGV